MGAHFFSIRVVRSSLHIQIRRRRRSRARTLTVRMDHMVRVPQITMLQRLLEVRMIFQVLPPTLNQLMLQPVPITLLPPTQLRVHILDSRITASLAFMVSQVIMIIPPTILSRRITAFLTAEESHQNLPGDS